METGSLHPANRTQNCTMKTGTDTYIQWKQERYDQDVIKSYSSCICLTPARKNTQTNSISHFLQNCSSFSLPPFLGLCPPPTRLGLNSFPPQVSFCVLAEFYCYYINNKILSKMEGMEKKIKREVTKQWSCLQKGGQTFYTLYIELLCYIFLTVVNVSGGLYGTCAAQQCLTSVALLS